ncbi:jmjC domain-containing protein, putative [Eimeria maxima]|uniref:JmjC domain-containing protein, putative n=1 Tax=Eimeria maxima TaxID=5804 RepID=U6MEZ0_EIMMA|nr:jmjC domain-containing protein, putative [Eimeria maxima]CDJ61613.1 jmjC domain-containing protein, putative [Eimeria maxima]
MESDPLPDGGPPNKEEEKETLEALHKAAIDLHEASWRRLHTGHWESVPLWCREAHGVACLLLGLSYAASGAAAAAAAENPAAAAAAAAADAAADAAAAQEDFVETAEKAFIFAFRYIDLGLIMGGPKIRVYKRLTAAAAAFDVIRERLLLLLQQEEEEEGEEEQEEEEEEEEQQQQQQQQQQRDNTPSVSLEPLVPINRRRSPVEERTSIGFEDFLVNYLQKDKPLLIRGNTRGISEFPCVNLWRDWRRLRKQFGHRLVPIEIGSSYAEEGWTQRLMLFDDFYTEFIEPSSKGGAPMEGPIGYLAQHALLEQLPFLAKEAPIPDLALAWFVT